MPITIDTIKLKRGTAADLAGANPVLLDGEPCVESDTGKIKVGDGTSAWNTLPYSGSAGSVAWADIQLKPSTFPPETHFHTGTYEPANANIQSHIAATGNTHGLTLGDIGAAASIHNHSITNLTGVNITSPANNDVLKWSGTEWVNGAASGGGGATYIVDWSHSGSDISSLILPMTDDGFFKMQARIVTTAGSYDSWCLQLSTDGTNFVDGGYTHGGMFNLGNPGAQFGANSYNWLNDPWTSSHPDFMVDCEFVVKAGAIATFTVSTPRGGNGMSVIGTATSTAHSITHMRVKERNNNRLLQAGSYVKMWKLG